MRLTVLSNQYSSIISSYAQYMEGIFTLPLTGEENLAQQWQLCDTALSHWLNSLNPASRRESIPCDSTTAVGKRVTSLYNRVLHLIYK